MNPDVPFGHIAGMLIYFTLGGPLFGLIFIRWFLLPIIDACYAMFHTKFS